MLKLYFDVTSTYSTVCPQPNPKNLLHNLSETSWTHVQPWNQTHWWCENIGSDQKVWISWKVTLKLLDEFSDTSIYSSEIWEIRWVKGSRSREGAAGEMKPRREISSAGRRWREPPYSWILEVPAPNTGSLWMDGERLLLIYFYYY